MRIGLSGPGYCRTEGLLEPASAARMAEAVGALRAEDLHPLFLFVYDEPWEMLGRIVPLVSAALGEPVEPLADFWSWHVDPRRDAGGWAPHRGWYEDVRGPDGLPSLLNVWLSLSAATPENGCMHIVPLGDDPAWPGALDRRPFDLEAGRAIPTTAGAALTWNANALHWGGTTDPRGERPRISASFSLARAAWEPESPRLHEEHLSFPERLDRIAQQIEVYGALEMPEGAPLREWARIRLAMRALRGKARARTSGKK